MVAPRSNPARPSPVFDRAELRTALDSALQGAGLDSAARRAAVVGVLRKALDEGREKAHAMLDLERNGHACARRLSDLMDAMVAALHDIAVRVLYPVQNPSTSERLAVVAVGGYGRGTLAPGSDVDLLFLLPYKTTPWSESVVESILYALWDLKLKVGHSTRSLDECIREAHGDYTIRTALLEARLILGDKALFTEFEGRFDRDVVQGTASQFVSEKLAERERRVNRAGQSRYLVEPNVKDGKGGLRDLNTLFWIAKYVYRVRRTADLVEAGLFSQEEADLFRRCDEFLWRVRCQMHYVTGRAEERLTFDLQRQIAEKLGYATHGGMSSVERFMKRYFLVAKDVGDLTAIVCAALEARHAKPRAMLDRLVGRFRRSGRAISESKDFVVDNDRLSVARPDVFERDPVNLIRLFWIADKLNRAIHPDAARLVTRSLKLIGPALRNTPEANRLFIEVLTSTNAPEVVLRRMNEAGVLGRFVPEFGRVVAMMQFNMYHHYTVDEHLIRSIGILADIENGRLKDELPVANEILPTIRNRTILAVALFIHDIAKGRPEDHSVAGARIARKLCPRLGLTDAETDTVAWLVEQHLTMSTVAQSRDLSDPKTIQTFAAIVQTLERLRMLLVLTVCDIKAVGPGVWNGWKGQLLRTLYWETEIVLAGGHSQIERAQRVRQAQEELRRALPTWPDAEVDAYLARHYPAYWLKVDVPRKVQHALLLRSAERELRSLATEVATDSFRGVTELTVTAQDHPRLLAIITGACAAAGANIVDAQIFTTTDGMALDTIFVSRAFDMDEDELRRGARVAQHIEKALKGEIKIAEAVAARGPDRSSASKAFTVPPQIMIDNALSTRHTVIEVAGLDRPGLLYELTTALGRLNLNIASAHIATFGEKAVDVFYVTDLTGSKIVNPAKQGSIRRHLMDVLQARDTHRDREPKLRVAAGGK
ncbi:bifunctional uridylyltransferase/uridylyl-removing enzyme [Alsobacter metallidurans]|uniref:Bifunctional uridylyltransferase/uridylyl-removing enzyme n=1 Tax=Alsobacter metallidurans TaxID=340221 RepID=A0A917MGE0_9HYPH|nr:[protein-PII] uridylyltransferase [Alsobacter metallidurans]GGH08175.1 bifunctional uridylyltransferase/uridylyl-removing enzyme [Alsobacter metallidurans]